MEDQCACKKGEPEANCYYSPELVQHSYQLLLRHFQMVPQSEYEALRMAQEKGRGERRQNVCDTRRGEPRLVNTISASWAMLTLPVQDPSIGKEIPVTVQNQVHRTWLGNPVLTRWQSLAMRAKFKFRRVR